MCKKNNITDCLVTITLTAAAITSTVRIGGTMKNKIMQLGEWGKRHWLQLIVIMGVVMMTFLVFVLISWLIGYWANALIGTRFELTSCWSGVAAVASGMATIVGLGKACWTKYGYDSRFNSARYTMPISQQNAPTGADNKEKKGV